MPLLQIKSKYYYKLRYVYYKLRQKVIANYVTFTTNYGKKFISYIKNLFQITAAQIFQNY